MGVRAIFYIDELVSRPGDVTDKGVRPATGTVKLRAAAKGPYKHWSKWTPSGTLELGTLNEQAFAWFAERLGQDVAITFGDPTAADLATE
jgi:hypothetical protein